MQRKKVGGVKPILSDQDGYEIKDAIKQKGIGVTEFLKESGFTQGYLNSIIKAKSDATPLLEKLSEAGIAFEPAHYAHKEITVIDFDDIDNVMRQVREKGLSMTRYMKKIGKSPSYIYMMANKQYDSTWLVERMRKDGITL